jgi:penicillin-binding protein 2
MYSKRVKLFVAFSALLLGLCVLRLAQMQLLSASAVQEKIAELKRERGQSKQLKTIRGRILDRNGRVLAIDEAQFSIQINYELSCFLDERVQQVYLDEAAAQPNPEKAVERTKERISAKLEALERIIHKCAKFKGVDPSEIRSQIQQINDRVWAHRMFQAWRRNFPDSDLIEKYPSIVGIPNSEAMADFEKHQPDPDKRRRLAGKVDIAEMHKNWPLLELKTDDDIFAAQLEFIDTDGIRILPQEQRFYPYGTVAAQTIGWVGPATQQQDKEPFADDKLSSYLEGELCGREDGVEYVCESVLRGRRGEVVKDLDKHLVSRTPTELGRDVTLTLDIELQKRIEDYLLNCPHDPNRAGYGISAVVIEVATAQILALVSLPDYDLNRVRYDYGDLVADPAKPLINRAINAQYPAGSVIKPVILTAGLETGKITPQEVISCPSHAAPAGWPNCWIYKSYHVGHDTQWLNMARNAIKGSCNVYFSRLADRIEPKALQQWLFKFGYGHDILFVPAFLSQLGKPELDRNFDQLSGTISSTIPREPVRSFDDVPSLRESDRRWFGIGQGNLRVTPLQVANAMAALARGGIFKRPQLFRDEPSVPDARGEGRGARDEGQDLGVHLQTLSVIYDGMSAVVNEVNGTAYTQFEPFLRTLAAEDVKVYGKTGSTERPEHAWFAGFAADGTARKIAIAVIVEGGQHGPSDAAPLARDIVQFCIEAGYLGKPAVTSKFE